MKFWFQQLRLEIRLLNGQGYLYLLPLLYGAWLAFHLSSIIRSDHGNLFILVFQYHSAQFVITLGIAMILGILLIRRDLHRVGYGWMKSLPVTSFTQVTTKFAAGLGYLTLFTLCMAAVVLFYGLAVELPGAVLRDHLLFFIIQSQLSYAVTLSLAILLSVTISSRICYLIGFCAWMFGTFFIDLVLVNGMKAFPLITFHLSQFTLTSPLESEMFGYSLYHHELVTIRLFVLSFTVLMLVSSIVYLNRLRPSTCRRQWLAAFMFILVFTIAAYYPNGSLWMDRYAFLNKLVADSPDFNSINIESELPPSELQVNEYHLHMNKGPGEIVHFHARLSVDFTEIGQQQQTISFTLNRQFHVERVLLDGKEASLLSRDGDIVQINWNSAEDDFSTVKEVELFYSGSLKEWLVVDGYPTMTSLLTSDHVYLLKQEAWYPVPGRRHLYASIRDSQLVSLSMGPYYYSSLDKIPFTVTAENFPYELFSSLKEDSDESSPHLQIFRGRAEGVTLLGNRRLIEVSIPEEPVTVVTTASNKQSAERFLTDLHEHLNYYRSWLDHPLSEIDQVFYHPMTSPYRYPNGADIQENALFLEESISRRLDHYMLHQTVISMLFHDTVYYYDYYGFNSEEENGSVTNLIRSTFFYLYLRDHLGYSHLEIDEGAYWDVFPLLNLYGYTNELNKEIYLRIDQAIAEGKVDQVKEVLREFHRRGLTMTSPYNIYYTTDNELQPVISKEEYWSVWERHVDDNS